MYVATVVPLSPTHMHTIIMHMNKLFEIITYLKRENNESVLRGDSVL